VTDTNGVASDRLLSVTVNPLNDPPTLTALSDLSVPEDNGPTSVPLSGIGPGAANELQMLAFTVVSSNPALIPNPALSYLHPQSTGTRLVHARIQCYGKRHHHHHG
jgi:hypothetical protein